MLGFEDREVGTHPGVIIQQRRKGLIEDQLDRRLIDFFGPHADVPRRRRRLMDGLVVDDVVGPEGHVIGGEGGAVGPFVALAQGERDLGEGFVPFPGLGHVGNDGLAVVEKADHIVLTPSQDLRGSRLVLAGQAAQGSAVLAAFVVGQHHQRLGRQPFRHRRQFPALDALGKKRVAGKFQRLARLLLEISKIDLLREGRFQPLGIGNRRTNRRLRRRRESNTQSGDE